MSNTCVREQKKCLKFSLSQKIITVLPSCAVVWRTSRSVSALQENTITHAMILLVLLDDRKTYVLISYCKLFRVTTQLKIQLLVAQDASQQRRFQAFARWRRSELLLSPWRTKDRNVRPTDHSNTQVAPVYANRQSLLFPETLWCRLRALVVNRYVLSNTTSPWPVTTDILSSSTSTSSHNANAKSRNAAPPMTRLVSKSLALVDHRREANVPLLRTLPRQQWTRILKNDIVEISWTTLPCCMLARRNVKSDQDTPSL